MRIPAMSRSFLRFAHMYKLEQVFSAILTSQNGVYFMADIEKKIRQLIRSAPLVISPFFLNQSSGARRGFPNWCGSNFSLAPAKLGQKENPSIRGYLFF